MRERREDIEALIRHFLVQAEGEGLPRRTITRDAIRLLEPRQWAGNVRELRNVVFRLALMARDDVIDPDAVTASLPPKKLASENLSGSSFTAALAEWLAGRQTPNGTLYQAASAAFEKPLFEHALKQTEGNQLRAAELLGINRNTLRKRLAELDIRPEAFVRRR